MPAPTDVKDLETTHNRKLWVGILLAAATIAVLVADIRISIKQRDPVEYAAGILKMRARRTAELADAIEAVSYQFLSNQLLNETLDSYISDNERYDVSKWNKIFSEHMEGLAETVPELMDAVFFDAAGGSRIPLTMSDSLTRSLWIPVRDTIAEKTLAADGQPVWGSLPGGDVDSGRRAGGTPPTLLCARLIKRRSDLKRLGILILLIDPDRLARTVSGFSQDEGIAVSRKTDYSLLLDEEGTIIASVDPGFAAKPAADAIPGYDEHFGGKLPLGDSGSYRSRAKVNEEGREASFWVVYAPVPEKAWVLLSILPISVDAFPILIKILLVLGFAGSAWLIYATLGQGRSGIPGAEHDPSQGSPPLAELPGWYSSLTPKEQTVLLFLLTGKSNKEIASILDIREQTVKNYLHAIYQRIGAQDRTSAIILMQNAGLTMDSLRRYSRTHPEFEADTRLFA